MSRYRNNGCYVLSVLVCMVGPFSHVRLFSTLWSVACQAPLSMELSKQEYLSGLPFPSPGGSSRPRD